MNDKVSTMILYISYHIFTMVMVIPTGHNKVGQSKSLWSPSSVNISKCFFMMHKLSPLIMQHYVFMIKLKAVHRINFVVGQSLQLASLSAFDLALASVTATFQLHVSCWMSLILLKVFSL